MTHARHAASLVAVLCAFGTGLSVTGLSAADSATVKLESALTLGEHWYGPERTLEDLKGRVVLIEDWGYN